jgi:hypothetical protein
MGYDVRVLTASNSLYPLGLPLEIPSERVVYTRWIDVNHPFYWMKDKNIHEGVDADKEQMFGRNVSELWLKDIDGILQLLS